MKVLVTGVTGQLGYDVVRVLRGRGVETVGATRAEMPLDDPEKARAFVEATRPDAVIHCAAYTAVDKAEDDEDLAAKINIDGPCNLAKSGAKVIHISTDYVFDGSGHKPYQPEDETRPVSVYGRTKLAGEQEVLKYAEPDNKT